MASDPSRFASRGLDDLADLAATHPLAWLCSVGPSGLMATPLPLLLQRAADGRLLAVEGHLARTNPQVAALQAQPDALLLWMGVQGYVSPSWMADRTQAPTWNYASAQCRVHVRFDEGDVVPHLRTLVDAHEAGRPDAWSMDEMGARLHLLAPRVIGFRAEVVQLQERYKLGQDERDDVFADILAGLDAGGPSVLAAWMRRFNPGRGPASTVNDPPDAAGATPPA